MSVIAAGVFRIGTEPELRFTANGTEVCNFRAASKRRSNGEDVSDWYGIVCFGSLANFAQQYLKKGREVFLSGDLEPREYTAKDGTNRTALEIVARKIDFVGAPPKAEEQRTVETDNLPFD